MSDDEDDFTPEQKFELAKSRDDQKTRRHEVRWATYKAIGVALVGTAAVGVTGALVNYEIQNTQLALEQEKTRRQLELEEKKFEAANRDERRRQEQTYLQQFLSEALNEDIQRRIDFAQYVGSVTLNEEMRDLWTKYHKALENELNSLKSFCENQPDATAS